VLVGVGVGVGELAPLDVPDGVAAQATSRARTAAAPIVVTLPLAALCLMIVKIMCSHLVCVVGSQRMGHA
jgi:hypothetical protein